MTREEKLDEYERIMGKKPRADIKDETLNKKLGIPEEPKEDPPEDSPQDYPEQPPVHVEVVTKNVKQVEKVDLPLAKGSGRKTQYLVTFRGNHRYWTQGTIDSMSKQFKGEISFPTNSPYQKKADFNTCKSC